MHIDKGIRIAREMAEQQLALAHTARETDRNSDAEAHGYAHRVLHAISATSHTVSDALAFRWSGEERDAQRTIGTRDEQKSLECGYAATILEHLAIAIRTRIEPQ